MPEAAHPERVQATHWDAHQGGHHVSGTLSFPAIVNDAILLDGVSQLTVIVVDVDAPERIFIWDK